MSTPTKVYPAFLRDPRRACANVPDPDIFFPPPGTSLHVGRAKAVCASCQFQQECADWGIEHEEHGIYGGLTAQERGIRRRKERA